MGADNHSSSWEQLVLQDTNGVFLGLIKCPKVGGPDTLVLSGTIGQKSGLAAARPAQ